MAKITSKASLVSLQASNNNLVLHVVDKQGTDIGITKSGDTYTIASSTTNFTNSATVNGITKRGIVVGDLIKLSHTSSASNEGIQMYVTTATSNSLTCTTTGVTQTSGQAGATEAAGSDINITAFKKTYQFLEVGSLNFVDGVQGIILASKLVDMWDAGDLDIYDRVFASIEPRAKSIASINGWEPHDTSTLNAIRDTALEIRPSASAAATKIYALFRSTGNAHESTDQLTFWYGGDAALTAPNNFVMTGYANQLALIYDYNNGTPVDKRGTWYTRLAIEYKTIIMEQHSVNYAEIYPISAANGIDPKLTLDDDTDFTSGAFSNILYYKDIDGIYSQSVDGTPYDFAGYIDADLQTNEYVHHKIHWLLRQSTNINSDGTGAVMRGDKQWPITSFSGDVFTVKSGLLDYKTSQRNYLRLIDTGGNTRMWPTVYTLSIKGTGLSLGGTFSVIHEDSFGASGAVYLKNDVGTDQKDQTITSDTGITVAYSTYTTGGHTANTPLALRVTYNRPGYIEPDSVSLIMDGDETVTIQPTADPSYTAA
jgi:hypothetical protein